MIAKLPILFIVACIVALAAFGRQPVVEPLAVQLVAVEAPKNEEVQVKEPEQVVEPERAIHNPVEIQNLFVESEFDDGGYDRRNWSFRSGWVRSQLGCNPSEDADHFVSLKEAYESGASVWSREDKKVFANDLENLWCLAAGANRSKRDYDPAEWSNWESYIGCSDRWAIAQQTITIKIKYELSIDQEEKLALVNILNTRCS